MTVLVEVCGLVKDYDGHRAVDDVSFVIGSGETVALVGESGSGKTTIGRCLLRLTEPTAGVIRFDGDDIGGFGRRALQRWRRNAQPVFQDCFGSLNPRIRVGQAIGEGLLVQRQCSRAQMKARVAELLDEVGLEASHSLCYPHQLSGGQRQRVAIARAIAVRPRLIVLDEPLSALDVGVHLQILALLRRLQAETGVSYLFISHSVGAVRHLAHRTLVLLRGRVVEAGETDTLLDRPQHPYTQELVAAHTWALATRDPRAPPTAPEHRLPQR